MSLANAATTPADPRFGSCQRERHLIPVNLRAMQHHETTLKAVRAAVLYLSSQQNMTPAQLAAVAGIHQHHLVGVLAGIMAPSDDELGLIAAALGEPDDGFIAWAVRC